MIELNVKFPKGMSQRDKNVIKDWLYLEFEQKPPKTQDEAYLRLRAYVEEYFCLGTRHHGKLK